MPVETVKLKNCSLFDRNIRKKLLKKSRELLPHVENGRKFPRGKLLGDR